MDEREEGDLEGLENVREKIVCDDQTTEYDVFIPTTKFPSLYESSWFKDVLQWQLEEFDDDRCDRILRKYEEKDWDSLFAEHKWYFSLRTPREETHIDSGPPIYYEFLSDTLMLVSVLHRRKPEWIERVLTLARMLFFVDPMYFMFKYYKHLNHYMPSGEFVKGNCVYRASPVEAMLANYALRLLKDRFPFCCIYVDLKAIEMAEQTVTADSLEEHKRYYRLMKRPLPEEFSQMLYWKSKKRKHRERI